MAKRGNQIDNIRRAPQDGDTRSELNGRSVFRSFSFCPIFVILFNLTSSILKSNFLFVKSFCSLELLILKINRRHQTKMKIIDGSRQNEASKPKDNGDVRLVCLENQKGTRRWLWISWTRIPVENSSLASRRLSGSLLCRDHHRHEWRRRSGV